MRRPKKSEFSKTLLKQEAALIWIMSLAFLALAFYCIYKGFTGSLPWLTAMIGFPWTAYGVSQACYYKKSEKENTCGGVKYESVILEAQQLYEQAKNKIPEVNMEGIDIDAIINDFSNNTNNNNYQYSENPDDYQI